MGREGQEGRVQLESVKIENKQRPALKIPLPVKISPVIQSKLNSVYFVRPTLPGSFLVHASGNYKQNFPGLILGSP